eukprot:gb/GECH01006785.1/.p1 GENE.gb/GECH01006785.1/~~gb/GECH01006785.1/.p1  ORF type:complete len:574 (+),score=122.67 gb/GECH01006785.1/:1-1722(+)
MHIVRHVNVSGDDGDVLDPASVAVGQSPNHSHLQVSLPSSMGKALVLAGEVLGHPQDGRRYPFLVLLHPDRSSLHLYRIHRSVLVQEAVLSIPSALTPLPVSAAVTVVLQSTPSWQWVWNQYDVYHNPDMGDPDEYKHSLFLLLVVNNGVSSPSQPTPSTWENESIATASIPLDYPSSSPSSSSSPVPLHLHPRSSVLHPRTHHSPLWFHHPYSHPHPSLSPGHIPLHPPPLSIARQSSLYAMVITPHRYLVGITQQAEVVCLIPDSLHSLTVARIQPLPVRPDSIEALPGSTHGMAGDTVAVYVRNMNDEIHSGHHNHTTDGVLYLSVPSLRPFRPGSQDENVIGDDTPPPPPSPSSSSSTSSSSSPPPLASSSSLSSSSSHSDSSTSISTSSSSTSTSTSASAAPSDGEGGDINPRSSSSDSDAPPSTPTIVGAIGGSVGALMMVAAGGGGAFYLGKIALQGWHPYGSGSNGGGGGGGTTNTTTTTTTTTGMYAGVSLSAPPEASLPQPVQTNPAELQMMMESMVTGNGTGAPVTFNPFHPQQDGSMFEDWTEMPLDIQEQQAVGVTEDQV